ncbi:helix-turn-helix domain-containing protein, partial [Ameyamaea chiangmaiensis]
MAATKGVGAEGGKGSPGRAEGADRVGPTLRARREQLGWSLDDVAAWLRIRLSYLQALEDGGTGNMPGDAYVVGFLRTYAGALGFDAEDMVARFKRETGGLARKPELTFPSPVPDRALPAGVIVLLGCVVIVAAYAGWYRYTDHGRSQPQPVPPINDVMPGVTAHSTTSPQLATVMPPPGHAPKGGAVPEPAP